MKTAVASNAPTLRSFLQRAKFALAGLVKQNATLWSIFWNIGARFDFLLPHDKSYYGFAHFAISKSNGLFLDVGANNGITALGVHKVLPAYSIISIEADPSHQPALERAKRRITKFQYQMIGASNIEQKLVLYTPRLNGRLIHALTSSNLEYLKVSVTRDFGESKAGTVTYDRHYVKCVPLDQLDLSPDIIKIDIEGHELLALTGLSNTIDRQRPIIMIEFTPGFSEKTVQFLAAKGYEFFVYKEDEDVFYYFENDLDTQTWGRGSLQLNLFSIPKERVAGIANYIGANQSRFASI